MMFIQLGKSCIIFFFFFISLPFLSIHPSIFIHHLFIYLSCCIFSLFLSFFRFESRYNNRALKKCRKIGEGVFGEVFLNEINARSSYVLKIIPIEGDEEINGAQQKRFHEILQEIIISQELSGLRYGKTNASAGFVEVLNVRFVEGRYPNHLLKLWHDFNDNDQSENDCPDVFGADQLYVVFELANCGLDLEATKLFKSAEQSFSAFKQVNNTTIVNVFQCFVFFFYS